MTDQEADLNGDGGGEELLDKSNSEMPVLDSKLSKTRCLKITKIQTKYHFMHRVILSCQLKTFLNHHKEKQNSLLKVRVIALKKSDLLEYEVMQTEKVQDYIDKYKEKTRDLTKKKSGLRPKQLLVQR